MIYLQLFLSYLKIGFFGFGGGYAMLSLIQNEIVEQRGWLTTMQFADIVAVSQMTPGPIAINSATYIGYEIGGVFGSVVATFAVCLPSLTLMLLLTRLFLRHRENRFIQNVVKAVGPVVVGMIASAALLMMFPMSANKMCPDIARCFRVGERRSRKKNHLQLRTTAVIQLETFVRRIQNLQLFPSR